MKALSRTPLNTSKFYPAVERLECRIAPAVVISVFDLDGDGTADDIRLVGDAAKNIVQIQDNGVDTLIISVDADGDGDTTGTRDTPPTNFLFSGNSVTLDIKLGGGSDVFNYSTTASLNAATRMLTADLGSGSNTFSFATDNFDVLNTSRISLDVTGRSAVDTVTVQFDEVRKSSLTVSLALGKGNDSATVEYDRIDDGSSVELGVDLGAGLNVLTMDFQEIGFGDRGIVHVDIAGGAQKDTVTLNLHDDVGNGVVASLLNFKADLGAGNDIFTANVDYGGNVFRVDDHSLAFIAVKGGLGNDSLSVKGAGTTGTIRLDMDCNFTIDLLGGAGNDSIEVDLSKPDGLELIGAVRLWLDGGIGNDILKTMLANNVNTTGNYDLVVLGGQGDDQTTFQLINNAGTPTFGPTGKALLDGGLGTDILTNNSKPLSKDTGFEQII